MTLPTNRAEAKLQGLTRYFTGKPCKHGHVAERVVSNAACATCAYIRRDQWAKDNPEKVAEQNTRWVKANHEKVLAANARWRSKNTAERAALQREYRANNLEKEMRRQSQWLSKNTDKMKAINSKWYENNRHKVHIRDARRRSREASSIPLWDQELTEFVTLEASNLARMREEATGIEWHVDHMIPLRARLACGLHTWSNLQVIPARLNLWKGNRWRLTEPREWLGFI